MSSKNRFQPEHSGQTIYNPDIQTSALTMNNVPNVQTCVFSGFQIAKTDGSGARTNLDLALELAQQYGYWRGSCTSCKSTMHTAEHCLLPMSND